MIGKIVLKQLNAIDIPFDFNQTYKFLKIKRGSGNFDMVQGMIDELYRRYIHQFEPKYCFKFCKIAGSCAESYCIQFDEDDHDGFTGRGIYKLLSHSNYAVCFALTMGDSIDKIIYSLSEEDFAHAYFMDSIASTVIHGLIKLLEKELKDESKKLNFNLGKRFSPGYARWELSQQKKLLAMLRAEKIGIRLSKSYYMLPRKSVSGVYALH